MLDRVAVVVQSGVRHAQVVVDRANRIVSGIGGCLRVSLDGLGVVLELGQAVADLVVDQTRLTGGKRVFGVLQAGSVQVERLFEILGGRCGLRLLE